MVGMAPPRQVSNSAMKLEGDCSDDDFISDDFLSSDENEVCYLIICKAI